MLSQPPVSDLFVLVAGWPGSGKSTLAAALAAEMRLPLLAKDEIKEALMAALAVRRPWPSRSGSAGLLCSQCCVLHSAAWARCWTAPGSITRYR